MRGNKGSQSGGKNENQEGEGEFILARVKSSFQGRYRDIAEREGGRTD